MIEITPISIVNEDGTYQSGSTSLYAAPCEEIDLACYEASFIEQSDIQSYYESLIAGLNNI